MQRILQNQWTTRHDASQPWIGAQLASRHEKFLLIMCHVKVHVCVNANDLTGGGYRTVVYAEQVDIRDAAEKRVFIKQRTGDEYACNPAVLGGHFGDVFSRQVEQYITGNAHATPDLLD